MLATLLATILATLLATMLATLLACALLPKDYIMCTDAYHEADQNNMAGHRGQS